MKITDHRLSGPKLQHLETPNRGQEFAKGLPDTIVIHYTASPSTESAVKILTTPSAKASAHLVIGRDGTIVQLAPFNVVTWHAGQSEHQGRVGLNQYSIGIEIDNAGALEKRAEGYYSWFGTKYDEKDVVQAVHRNEAAPRYWHTFTETQISLVMEICMLLVSEYNVKFIVGHEEISPKRKIDPGPAFPLDRLREKVLSSGRDNNESEEQLQSGYGVVTTDKLNIRSSPNTSADKVALPLTQGKRVKILEARNGWYHVETVIEGWVSSDYIRFTGQ